MVNSLRGYPHAPGGQGLLGLDSGGSRKTVRRSGLPPGRLNQSRVLGRPRPAGLQAHAGRAGRVLPVDVIAVRANLVAVSELAEIGRHQGRVELEAMDVLPHGQEPSQIPEAGHAVIRLGLISELEAEELGKVELAGPLALPLVRLHHAQLVRVVARHPLRPPLDALFIVVGGVPGFGNRLQLLQYLF